MSQMPPPIFLIELPVVMEWTVFLADAYVCVDDAGGNAALQEGGKQAMDVAAARDENDPEDEIPGSQPASQRQEPRAVIECWSTAGGHLDSPKSLPYSTQIGHLDPRMLCKGSRLSVCLYN